MRQLVVTADRLSWQEETHRLEVRPWGPDGIRVRAAVGPLRDDLVGALELPVVPGAVSVVRHDDGSASLTHGRLTVTVSAVGELIFTDQVTGVELLREQRTHVSWPRTRDPTDAGGACSSSPRRSPRTRTRSWSGWVSTSTGCSTRRAPSSSWCSATPRCPSRSWCPAAATGSSGTTPPWGGWSSAGLMTVARRHHELGLPMSVIVNDFFHWRQVGDWDFDAWDGTEHAGGQTITVAAPLDRLPVLIRAGSGVVLT